MQVAALNEHGRGTPASMANEHWQTVAGSKLPSSGGKARKHYIMAEEVEWDYVPKGYNGITGEPFGEKEAIFVSEFIGSVYTKCLYFGYTDDTFTKRLERPPEEQYLGLLGPVLHAEVGDTLELLYKNSCSFPNTLHAHGVLYKKASEGAPHDDGSSAAASKDDAVMTGDTHLYTWEVPERAGPGPSDGSSVMWLYHSHTDEPADTYAGMLGPMVITAKGMADADGKPKDVDKEVFAFWSVMNEGLSSLTDKNMLPEGVPEDQEEDFEESNLMHALNGFLYGNMPELSMEVGLHTRWYNFALGTEVDLHTPHWHGQVVLVGGMRTDVVNLLPASMVVADMVPDNPGKWLVHCHVNDHLEAGMLDSFTVVEAGSR